MAWNLVTRNAVGVFVPHRGAALRYVNFRLGDDVVTVLVDDLKKRVARVGERDRRVTPRGGLQTQELRREQNRTPAKQ